MSGIDRGLLPRARRAIYGNAVPRRNRRNTTASTRRTTSKQHFSLGGYETDVEDNKPRMPRSPPRPDPTIVPLGGYEVSRPGATGKRKRKSTGASTRALINEDSESAAPAVPVIARPRRRYAGMKKRRSAGGAQVVKNDTGVGEDAVAGYAADDERNAQGGEGGGNVAHRGGRGRRRMHSGRGDGGKGGRQFGRRGDGDVEIGGYTLPTRSRKFQ